MRSAAEATETTPAHVCQNGLREIGVAVQSGLDLIEMGALTLETKRQQRIAAIRGCI
eukprot:COSAG05_NODE_14190_length_405_cov_0.666667_1_plen_57_part_00